MLKIAEQILTILMALTPSVFDANEGEAERTARMTTIALAIADASAKATCEDHYRTEDCAEVFRGSRHDMALLLTVTGYHESRFARHIHAGNCRPNECDSYRDKFGELRFRARTPWQLHKIFATEEVWDSIVGVEYEPTRTAAFASSRVLARGMHRCGPGGAFAGYLGIWGKCKTEAGRSRVAMFWRLRAKYRDPVTR